MNTYANIKAYIMKMDKIKTKQEIELTLYWSKSQPAKHYPYRAAALVKIR